MVWLSLAIMSGCTCQVGLLRSRWFGGSSGVASPKYDGCIAAAAAIASRRVGSPCRAPGHPCIVGLAISLPSPNGFLLRKTLSSSSPPLHTLPRCCYRTAAVPRLTSLAKRYCRVSLIRKLRFTLRRPAKASPEHCRYCTAAALTQAPQHSLPHHRHLRRRHRVPSRGLFTTRAYSGHLNARKSIACA